MTQRVGNPFAPFVDLNGLPLTGSLRLGVEGADPEASPITAYFDEARTIEAVQPIVVVGGVARYQGNPALIYVEENEYSIKTFDEDGGPVIYAANGAIDADQFQPIDSDLTAIAALSTTAFGRALLTLADAAALRTAAGITASLPLTGGTVTGSILRGSAGAHPYMADSAFTNARIFVTDNGATDPRTQPGDIWLEKAP